MGSVMTHFPCWEAKYSVEVYEKELVSKRGGRVDRYACSGDELSAMLRLLESAKSRPPIL